MTLLLDCWQVILSGQEGHDLALPNGPGLMEVPGIMNYGMMNHLAQATSVFILLDHQDSGTTIVITIGTIMYAKSSKRAQ